MDSPSDATRLIGGRYRLLAKLGQGGMGTVWRAHDELLHRTVAIKEVDLSVVASIDRPLMRERTLREARTAARLSHPNAVTVYDVVEDQDQPWIVMSLVVADSLEQVIRERGTLTPQRAAEVGLALLSALDAAHKVGILHRDVKPSNVLIGHDGSVVLTDFGIATIEGDASLTSTGMLFGAPAYIAPERARGERPGPASDLWSLGATLYAAVDGSPPFERSTPMATLTALVTEDLVPPRSAGPLRPALMALLERDPRRRIDATGARELLRQAAGNSGEATRPLTGRQMDTRALPPVPVGRPPEPVWAGDPPPPWPGSDHQDHQEPRRSRAAIVVILLLVALAAGAIGALAYVASREDTGSTPQARESATGQPTPQPSISAKPSPSPSLSPPPTLVTTWPTLRQGDKGERVRAAQYLLHDTAAELPADGKFSSATAKAVADFQDNSGLPVTGELAPTTWALLAVPTERGQISVVVQALQTLLNAQGNKLESDGVFGASTERALKSFQRAEGLTESAKVDSQTWMQLLGRTQ